MLAVFVWFHKHHKENTMKPTNQAFTLIELLVVVLIIGILAAVALPQYQKAVEKSKSAQVLTLLTTLGKATNVFQIENGRGPISFAELDIQIPDWTGNKIWYYGSDVRETKSNEDWSLQLTPQAIYLGRVSGPYAGAGFAYYFDPLGNLPLGTNVCMERYVSGVIFGKPWGSYCSKLMNFSNKHTYGGVYWFD